MWISTDAYGLGQVPIWTTANKYLQKDINELLCEFDRNTKKMKVKNIVTCNEVN